MTTEVLIAVADYGADPDWLVRRYDELPSGWRTPLPSGQTAREAYVASRWLLWRSAAELGISLTAQPLKRHEGPPWWSLSHTEGLAACMWSRHGRCGVDIERAGARAPRRHRPALLRSNRNRLAAVATAGAATGSISRPVDPQGGGDQGAGGGYCPSFAAHYFRGGTGGAPRLAPGGTSGKTARSAPPAGPRDCRRRLVRRRAARRPAPPSAVTMHREAFPAADDGTAC